MRVLKITIATLLIISLCLNLAAQKTIEKTLVKSFNLQGNDLVKLDVKGDIEVKEWSSPSIRIEMLVTLENGNETMLKSLIKAGRYNLTSEQTAESLKVFMASFEREIKVRGEVLKDKVSYVISIPEGVAIIGDEEVAAGMD